MAVAATAVVSRNLWIEVKNENGLMPEPKEMVVRSDVKDEAEWFSDDGESYLITFVKESPFLDKRFVVPAGGSVCSGPPRKGTHERYDYSIEPLAHEPPTARKEATPEKKAKMMTMLAPDPCKPVPPCGTIIIHP